MLLDRARRSRFRIALQSGTVRGTNKSAGAYPSDRPPFPPSPRAWSVTLGAVDGPIGCALIISCYFLALFLGGDSLCGASFFGNVVRSFCGVSTFGVARNDPKSI